MECVLLHACFMPRRRRFDSVLGGEYVSPPALIVGRGGRSRGLAEVGSREGLGRVTGLECRSVVVEIKRGSRSVA